MEAVPQKITELARLEAERKKLQEHAQELEERCKRLQEEIREIRERVGGGGEETPLITSADEC